ncbi:MAG TPA: glycosyltransferase family 4 protein [Acidimicrobiales bacterium]|nr:glycosyltransferase family 4 protein [Acidimicrobiales bacterium]
MIRHLLVTNDFPPKVGGIQSYLWELWRRLPSDDFLVLTSPYAGDEAFDRAQPYEVRRTPEPVLLPSPVMTRRIRKLAAEFGAEAVVLDPAVPLGLVGPELGLPYAAVLHGAEVTVPGRLPVSRPLLARVLRKASLLISAGGYPEAEARRAAGGVLPPVVRVPPGVDVGRFVPLSALERAGTRARLGLPPSALLVASVSRLVPRKGMDVLIEAASRLARSGRYPDLAVVIAGSGRDQDRLEKLIARTGAPVRLAGRIPDVDLPDFYACADVFALCCRSRWGGLEQEGFGIVFLEAAAAGVPSVAGDSGGAAEAVLDGTTGVVVRRPTDAGEVAEALERLLSDADLRRRQGQAARSRAMEEFAYDVLAGRLQEALDSLAKGC